jgi:hypothetical protein
LSEKTIVLSSRLESFLKKDSLIIIDNFLAQPKSFLVLTFLAKKSEEKRNFERDKKMARKFKIHQQNKKEMVHNFFLISDWWI